MSDAAPPPSSPPLYLVATDDGSTGDYEQVREVGLTMAREDGARVLLYDHTSESLLTDPYPVGPWSPEDDAVSPDSQLDPTTLEGLGRSYLADQLRSAREMGLQAQAYLAEGAGTKALVEAVERFRPDLLILPASMESPGLVDRLRSSTLDDLERQVDVKLRLVDTDGAVTEH